MSFTVIDHENDNTAEINSARINGTLYKFNYDGLKNRPCYVSKTPGTVLLASTAVEFYEEQEEPGTQQEPEGS